MSAFFTVTGADFARSIKWARQWTNPLNAHIRKHLMTTDTQIQNAINAAEAVAHPTARDDAPVTIDNKTMLTLIDAAKKCIEHGSSW